MLKLLKIFKNYYVGDQTIHALNDINLEFRQNEFVAILGPSGCGKTTLLNIIGGLDRYTSGDLIINGKSTKNFKDADWDAYRNRSIGFVFQTYNLIPHLSVLKNVELAPTLSGVSANIRKEKAIKALKSVGLGDQINKRPNQLSGGQMQRVSIARALVNDPDIILADEPTGALDTKTSIQILDILKEISKERLVIMVTHNEYLADKYATRIVKLLDGNIIDDDKPYDQGEQVYRKVKKTRTSMSLGTALSLSARNLMTKKMRTILTAFAASIGIIGIALILALSSGFSDYVDKMQGDTLVNMPINIPTNYVDYEQYLNYNQTVDYEAFPETDVIYPYQRQNFNSHFNNLSTDYEEYINQLDSTLYNAVEFNRSVKMNLLASSGDDNFYYIDNHNIRWNELLNNPSYVQSEYDVISGTYPSSYNEIALVVDRYNRIRISILDAFKMDTEQNHKFSDFIGKEFKLIKNDLYYKQEENGLFSQNLDFGTIYSSDEAITLRITGILRMNPANTSEFYRPSIVYTKDLTDLVLTTEANSIIGLAQKNNENKNVFFGTPIDDPKDYHAILQYLGVETTPNTISIYPKGFAEKDLIKAYLDAYNTGKSEDEQVLYNDNAQLISNTIGRMVNAVTYVLVAFSSISLFVSSIMIGIITYVSVIERTKEIGVLRSLGARKKDISRVFNAETIIIGFTAGLLGILIAELLTIPLNMIIYHYSQVADVASIKLVHAAILIGISVILTLIAGFVPSRIAANKDPVVALRTE